jgi:hypothetical protein
LVKTGFFESFFAEEISSDGGVESSKKTKKKSVNLEDEPMTTVRLGGLKNAMSRNFLSKSKEEETPKAQTSNSIELKPIDLEEARSLMKSYAKVAESKNQRSLAAFFADPLLEVLDGRMVFTVGSKTVALEVNAEAEKIKIAAATDGFEIISIDCKVNATKVSEYKIFTPQQQFDVMAKDHPALKEFESRFNLDFNE